MKEQRMSYVGRETCGCVVAVCAKSMPATLKGGEFQWRLDLAESLAGLIRLGLSVDLMESEAAVKAMLVECPHPANDPTQIAVYTCSKCREEYPDPNDAVACCQPNVDIAFYCNSCGIADGSYANQEAFEQHIETVHNAKNEAYQDALLNGYAGGQAMFEFEQRFV